MDMRPTQFRLVASTKHERTSKDESSPRRLRGCVPTKLRFYISEVWGRRVASSTGLIINKLYITLGAENQKKSRRRPTIRRGSLTGNFWRNLRLATV
jgi:hypothetical protein